MKALRKEPIWGKTDTPAAIEASSPEANPSWRNSCNTQQGPAAAVAGQAGEAGGFFTATTRTSLQG